MTQLDVAVVTLEKKYSTDEDATAAIKNMKAACSKHAADAARRETSVNFTVATGIISRVPLRISSAQMGYRQGLNTRSK